MEVCAVASEYLEYALRVAGFTRPVERREAAHSAQPLCQGDLVAFARQVLGVELQAEQTAKKGGKGKSENVRVD